MRCAIEGATWGAMRGDLKLFEGATWGKCIVAGGGHKKPPTGMLSDWGLLGLCYWVSLALKGEKRGLSPFFSEKRGLSPFFSLGV